MKYGFIGLGNMAGAILRGMQGEGLFAQDVLCGFDVNTAALQRCVTQYALQPMADAAAVAAAADVLLLCVKPQTLPEVLPAIAPHVGDTLVITVAAGRPLAWYRGFLGRDVALVRAMPNINARVQQAVTALAATESTGDGDRAAARCIFDAIGATLWLEEKHFAAFTAIGSSSLAFTYLYIDALATAAVRAGLPKKQALQVAAQAVLGSAALLLQEDTHPAALADAVCSPGGTTIEGVLSLKQDAFEGAVQRAIQAVITKDQLLSQERHDS